jgi:hypothetical protein
MKKFTQQSSNETSNPIKIVVVFFDILDPRTTLSNIPKTFTKTAALSQQALPLHRSLADVVFLVDA